MYRTHITLIFALWFIVGVVFTAGGKARNPIALASVGWHFLAG